MNLNDKGRPIPITFRGVFDVEQLYQANLNWHKQNLLVYHEKLYKDKPGDAGTREMELNTIGHVKLDDYHQWNVEVSFHIWDATLVEVVVDGKKKTMTRGRIEIMIEGKIDEDYQGIFDSSSFWKKMKKLLMTKILFWEEAFKQWDTYYYKLVGLQALFKQVLGMDTQANAF